LVLSTSSIQTIGLSSTSRYKNRRAERAWFCVEAAPLRSLAR
jgi:hypothetical protein